MGIMTAVEVGASGLSAQRKRLEVLVGNLVNANSTRPEGKDVFRRKDVVFSSSTPEENFGSALSQAIGAVQSVEISGVVTDQSEPVRRYEPGHPHADKDGYVLYPNVNPIEEMVNIMSATRSYEANLQAVNAAKEMATKTLELLR
jgi:flagellar basal-body rod protein FlgC